MKKLHLLSILMLGFIISSCSSSDDNNDNDEGSSGEPGVSVTIDGGTFDDYMFTATVTNITFNDNANTLNIAAGDTNGEQINIFLNSTNGFNANAVKEMGNDDINNFRTNVSVTSPNIPIYNSTTGNITITRNVVNPGNSNERLISGRFNNVSTSNSNGDNATITGTFTDLAY